MSWELVALISVALVCGVAAYAVYVWRSLQTAARDFAECKVAIGDISTQVTATSVRVAKLEAALRIDGQRIMAEAARNSIPAFMK